MKAATLRGLVFTFLKVFHDEIDVRPRYFLWGLLFNFHRIASRVQVLVRTPGGEILPSVIRSRRRITDDGQTCLRMSSYVSPGADVLLPRPFSSVA